MNKKEKNKNKENFINDSSINGNNNETIEKEINIYELISSVFKNKSKKIEIIEKLRPFFTLKVIPNREIDKVYSAVEKIDSEKVDLIEEFKYQEEKYDSKNLFETKSKSVGLSDFDLDLSTSIFGHKQSLKFENKNETISEQSRKGSKIHCIHSIVVSLFRMVIDFKDIKLARQINEELNIVEKSNATEKKILLEKLIDKFGLYVPLELLIGGRINISFEADNDEERKNFHNFLQNKIQAEFNGSYGNFSAQLNLKGEKTNLNENFSESINGIENLTIKMEGGDYLYKDDLKNWIKSFNIDNLQVIEYKTLIPIYCFVPGLESKLSICLEKYEDIVLQEIYNLIEKEFKTKEKNISEGSSLNVNSWEVGITKEIYKSFIILRKKIIKKMSINIDEDKEIKINDVICGKLPDGLTICGWILKTDCNSLPDDVVCNWERKKELSIIGNNCFKFRINMNIENRINQKIEVEWILEIFCIHSDFLVSSHKNFEYKNLKYIQHFFLNCDCCLNEKNECYYNEYITDENWKKLNKENIQNLKEIKEEKKEENKEIIYINNDEKKDKKKKIKEAALSVMFPLYGISKLINN